MTTAQRPENVPADAWWVQEDQEWEMGPVVNGAKHGAFRYWRADGTLCHECLFEAGVTNGAFKRFHENGEVSQSGQFAQGELHGTRTWYATDSLTTERMHEGGISGSVRRTEMDYDKGRVIAVRHFSGEGVRVLPDGSAYPARPADVPDDAEFRTDLELWAHGQLDPNNLRTGTWSFWSPDGTLVERSEHREGDRHGAASYFHPDGSPKGEGEFLDGAKSGPWREWNAAGRLIREADYEDDTLNGTMKLYDGAGNVTLQTAYARGLKSGPYFARVAPGYFSDPRIVSERGEFLLDHASGKWSFTDAQSTVLQTLDLGHAAPHDAALHEIPPFANEPRSGGEWAQLAATLLEQRHVGSALCASARAVATTGNTALLTDTLKVRTPALSPQAAQAAADHVTANGAQNLAPLVNALTRGASPAPMLRTIAILLDQCLKSIAALDYINAALALAPESREFYFTRSLIHMSVGRADAAREDALLLKPKEPDNSEFLLNYIRVLFPAFDFWPSHVIPETYYEDLPNTPSQSVEAIASTVRRYTKRIMLARQRLLTLVQGAPAWMIPDLSPLMTEDVELRVFDFEMSDGKESYSVHVDETVDASSWEVPAVLRFMRGEWAALCWLCWACGLQQINIPGAISAPPNLGQAAGMSAQRLWRCRDKVQMGGWGARNQNMPGFSWEGMDIDAMSPHLARIAEAEYAELQAMFYWLCGPENRSPWQDNLRGS